MLQYIFVYLVVSEASGDDDYADEDASEGGVVVDGVVRVTLGHLGAEGHKGQDAPHPEEHGETAKELLGELDPFRGRLGWREGVLAVHLHVVLGRLGGEADGGRLEPAVELGQLYPMGVELVMAGLGALQPVVCVLKNEC